jgi:hypothetical protein
LIPIAEHPRNVGQERYTKRDEILAERRESGFRIV